MSVPDYVVRFAPKIMEDNDTMKALYGTEAFEVEKLCGETKHIIDNLFIQTMDTEGVAKQEKFFNIKPNAFQTLEERKMILLNKILYRPPFTRQALQQILENIWGKGNFIYELYPDDYRMIIDIDTNNPTIYLQFSQQVREVVPANIYLILSIQYTHLYLGRNFTYERMESLTYGELSQYADININTVG